MFAAIGALNTGLHVAVYQLLLTFSVYYLLASGAGYAVGLVNSYALNRRFTFGNTASARWRPEFIRFVAVNLIALAVNLGILTAVVRGGSLGERFAVVPAVAGSLAVNFAGNKWWTFRRRERQGVDQHAERANRPD
jgi:putative flippase GtrA